MRKYPIISITSALLLLAGVVVIGVSVEQKAEMKANAGNFKSPALALHSRTSTATSISIPPAIARGDYLGTISIPALKSLLPIFQGTDNEVLKKGIGHYVQSVMPGVIDNSVLSGHRDSFFSQLGKLKIGEKIIVKTANGVFTYEISHFKIVLANDRTVIVPTKSAVLTLTTCYPFHFFGNAPKRFIVSADLISSTNT